MLGWLSSGLTIEEVQADYGDLLCNPAQINVVFP